MGTTGNDAILDQLVADGISYIFGNPGTVEQGLLQALEDEPRLHYILGLHETVAVAMADGYARASRRPAVVQLHSSVGVGNGIGMLYQAKRGHSPLVVLAGDAGVRYDATEAQMAADLVAMTRPVTKASLRVTDSRSVLRVLRRAIKIASTPPQGPVFVGLPADVLDELNDEPVHPSPIPVTEVVPSGAQLARAASLLAGAASPLILIGDGVDAALAQEPLRRVAELLGADVWGVNHSTVNFEARHPLYRGQLGHMFGDVSAAHVRDADAVLIVGTYVFPEVYPTLTDPFGESSRIVHIDLDVDNIAKNHRVDLGLVAHPGLTLAALAERLEAVRSPSERAAASERVRRRVAAQDAEPVPAPSGVAEHFVAALAQRVGDNLVVFDEALTGSPVLDRYLPARQPDGWHQTRGGSLGVGIPGALGIKLARPEAEVVAVTGDGGSMYTIQALATAARYGIAAKFVIWNNHRYRLLDLNLAVYRAETGRSSTAAPSGFDLSEPAIDFAGLAGSMGVAGCRVATIEEIGPALDQMLRPGPFLIDLQVD